MANAIMNRKDPTEIVINQQVNSNGGASEPEGVPDAPESNDFGLGSLLSGLGGLGGLASLFGGGSNNSEPRERARRRPAFEE